MKDQWLESISRAMEDARGLEFSDPVGGIAQIFFEQRGIVLAQHRRIKFDLLREARKPQREAGNLEFAENRIVDRPHGAARDQMRMLARLAHRKDRRDGYAVMP